MFLVIMRLSLRPCRSYNRMEGEEYEGLQPSKKAKAEQSFYLINRKIITFARLDEQESLKEVNRFLTDVAESISKPAHISEYEINETSLLRAKSLGYTTQAVIQFILSHAKNPPRPELEQFIQSVMETQPATRLFLLEEK
jgi:hypothetical protein